ncbi:MAG: S9 family peptidase [Myxococcota bacterium]|nr:S9 family peptidase [Myxococcota bacterium]
MKPVVPVAKRIPTSLSTHEHIRLDPYHWLRDDERQDAGVIEYLEAENAYGRAVLANTNELQDALYTELVGRLVKDDSSVPVRRRNYYYYARYEKDREYPIYCRRLGDMNADEEIILDVNQLAEGHAYYAVGAIAVSENEQLIAFTEDTVSRRLYTVRFKDLRTGAYWTDRVENTSGSVVWAADDQTVFYVEKDETTLRPYKVKRHSLGSAQTDDVVMHNEADETFYVGIERSKSRRYIMVTMNSTLVSETLVLDANTPTASFRSVLSRAPNTEYDVYHHGDAFYLRLNQDAPNFKLVAVPEDTPADKSRWREVIPHRDDVFLADIEVFEDFLVVNERKNACLGLAVMPWSNPEAAYDIEFDDAIQVVHLDANPEFETTSLRCVYSSPTTPNTVYEIDLVDQTRKILKQDKVLGGFDGTQYATHRLWAAARDGASIPISLVTPKDYRPDGRGALYLYAYGSYGYSMDPWFSTSWLSLLDRGVAVAIAHVRGGQELGRHWYDQGRTVHKMNTFLDYIDVATHLVAEGWASPQRLAAAGGSAGGLLIGAVANLRPDLFTVMHAAVPFVDVVSTMLDDSIPLTTGEYDEWGNPNEREAYFRILEYSPYDQVKAQAYPHLMVTTGLHDSQVQYWEPAKWVARLRHLKTDEHDLIFDIDMETGHGGASGRFKRYRKTAMVYAFILTRLGAASLDTVKV